MSSVIGQIPQPWLGFYPINMTNFQPQANIITQFTDLGYYNQGVTTRTPHNYLPNLLITFSWALSNLVPSIGYLFTQSFPITITSPTTFTIQVPGAASNFNAAPFYPAQPIQVLPVAQSGQSLASATNNDVNN